MAVRVAAALLLAVVAAAAPGRRHLGIDDAATAPLRRAGRRNAGALPFGLGMPASRLGSTPGTANCSELWYEQRLDHFAFGPAKPAGGRPYTFQQRYYKCLGETWQPGDPVFYYTGNEADVALYVNHTGLMWENARRFGAMLIFAEHRFFGKSLPYPGESMPPAEKLEGVLSVDQALADYAEHIHWLRNGPLGALNSPFIGFGGSYGGMLCAWLRAKYPAALDGCISGSAPVVNFEGMHPPFPAGAFAAAESFDATGAGGAAPRCFDNVRQTWRDLDQLAMRGGAGKAAMVSALGLCPASVSRLSPVALANLLKGYLGDPWADMAMSSYPYPSSYLLLGGAGMLPAYPVSVACKFLASDFGTNAVARLQGMSKAVLVYYNASGTTQCLDPYTPANKASQIVGCLWSYLACTTMFMPAAQDGVHDMLWPAPWNSEEAVRGCQQQFNGTTPQPLWPAIQYGGRDVARYSSNTVFSNGALDPWRPGGIYEGVTAPSIATVVIPESGHHIDLMFSDPADTPAIRAAREMELGHIAKWIAEKNKVTGRA